VSTCRHLDFPRDDPGALRLGLGAPALRYASLGFAVLPLARGGKKPHAMLGEHGGVHHASSDPLRIQEWWSQDMMANVGVATGTVSGLAVVDLDVKKGAAGPDQWAGFLAAYRLEGGGSVTAATPSGGFHVWFRTPPGAPVPDRRGILAGVDVKGSGGYVVAAPSMTMAGPAARPGEHVAPIPLPYYWTGGGCPCEAGSAPGWMDQWLRFAPPAAATGSAEKESPSPDLDGLMRTGIPAGQRNSGLYRLACSRFRVRGTNDSPGVLSELGVVNQAGGNPVGHRELLVILESARRWVAAQEDIDDQLYDHRMSMLSR
jgi:hypothetical protein